VIATGAKLVGLAFANRCGLSDRAALVLIRMCHVALDDANGDRPARTYFAGWEPLAMALGYDVPDGDDEDGRRNRRWMRRETARVVASLAKVGAVERVGMAHRGRRQEYRLHPERVGPPHTHKGGSSTHPFSAKGWDEPTPKGVSTTHPKEPGGTTEQEPTIRNHAARPSSRNGPVVDGDAARDDDGRSDAHDDDNGGNRSVTASPGATDEPSTEAVGPAARAEAERHKGHLIRLRRLVHDPKSSNEDIAQAAKLAGFDPDEVLRRARRTPAAVPDAEEPL
jgi:hypothetical protein